MIRLHGGKPANIFLIHGGPGAISSLNGFAKELYKRTDRSVVEQLQTKYSVEELLFELSEDINKCRDKAVTLIGHSWGAWLAALFASRYCGLIKKIILVSCPPLEEVYVEQINNKRLNNLTGEQKQILNRFLNNSATKEDMLKADLVFNDSDNYCALTDYTLKRTDNEMYNKIWESAAEMRKNGNLLDEFKNINCEICLIHGKNDPHPYRGVTAPLDNNRVDYKYYLLEKCGHNPFNEKFAKENFYSLITKELSF